jgi:hypothetical protein
MIKTLKKQGIESTFLNFIKIINDKPIENTILNEKIESIHLKVRNKAKVSTLPTLIYHSARTPRQSNKTGERNAREVRSQILPICR